MTKLVTTMSPETFIDLGREKVEVVTAAKSLLADQDCGKTFFLNSLTGLTLTLPSIASAGAGWRCKVIIKTACTSNTYIITEKTTADTNKIITNGISELETDTGDDGPYNAGHTTITFGTTALPGDEVEIVTDGTAWYAKGHTKADGAAVLA